jgi:hypothetical protein
MPVQAFEPTTLAILPYGQAVMEVLSYQASFADKCWVSPSGIGNVRWLYQRLIRTDTGCIRTTVLSIFALKLPRNQSVLYVKKFVQIPDILCCPADECTIRGARALDLFAHMCTQ